MGLGRRHVALIAVLVAACNSATPTIPPVPDAQTPSAETPAVPAGPTVQRIEVTPSAALLTGAGQSVQLGATASSTDGAAVPVTWRSSDPAQVTVDADGTVTAVVPLGSALVFAEAGDRTTAVTVLIAQPAPGALLVDDEQVVMGPAAVDPGVEPGVGSRVRVTLSGVEPPAAGTIILARGGAAIAGRVITAAPGATGTEIEYELVALPDLFASYRINVDLPLDVRDLADLGPVATAPPIATLALHGGGDGGITTAASVEEKVEKEITKGPLSCKVSAAASFSSSAFDIRASGKLVFQFLDEYQVPDDKTTPRHTRAVLTGPLALEVLGGLKAEAGFSGSAECSVVKHIRLPFGGPLAVIVAATVPIGLGVSADGKITAVDIEFGPKGHLGATLTLGFECKHGACWSIAELVPEANNGISFETKVNLVAEAKIDLGVSVHVITGLGGALGTGEYSLIDVKLGLKQSLSLALDRAQAKDPGYASNYDLKAILSVSPGESLKKGIDKILGENVAADLSFEVTPDKPLAQSPVGTLTADKSRVQVDRPVTLRIKLDPASMKYLSIDPNVALLRIARREKDGSLTTLNELPISASGQTDFDWTWTPTEKDVGMNHLVAFVVTKLLPVIPLEIKADSTTQVEVVDACLPEGTPPPVSPAPGGSPGASVPPAATDPPVDPCAADVTITHAVANELTPDGSWDISGSLVPVEQATLPPGQFADVAAAYEFAGIGTYSGSGMLGIWCPDSNGNFPLEAGPNSGEAWLFGNIAEDGGIWVPELTGVRVLAVTALSALTRQQTGRWSDPGWVFAVAPLEGGTQTYVVERGPVGACESGQVTTTTMTLAPGVATP